MQMSPGSIESILQCFHEEFNLSGFEIADDHLFLKPVMFFITDYGTDGTSAV